MSAPATEKTVEDELAELESELKKLDDARTAKIKALELEIAKLRLRFAKELGEEGRDFAVVPTGEGVVVVKRVSAIVSKRWRDAIMSDKPLTTQNAFEYVAPGVIVPDAETFKAWHQENDVVSTTVANELTRLYAAAEELRKGKR